MPHSATQSCSSNWGRN